MPASDFQPQGRRKLALITGATGGIGKATALALAGTGDFNLALHYNTPGPEHERDEFTKQCHTASKTGIKARFYRADLGNYDEVRKLYAQVRDELGDVDVLFANAGTTGGISGPSNLADVPIDVFETTWRVNCGSAILLTQLCLPAMEAQGWGRVIFDSSVAAFTGGFVGPHYASSKSAMHGFVHWLANNIAKKGVTVNAVAPALIGNTKMGGAIDADSNEAKGRFRDKLPVGRQGRPEEIADTVLWMINCAYVTNKVVTVDGGMYPY